MPQKEPIPNPIKFRNIYNKSATLFCCSISSLLTIVLALFHSNLFANYAYVTSTLGGTVSIIDTATNTLLPSTISVSGKPFGIAINPLGNYVYTACFLGNDIAVIDTALNSVVATITVGTNPYHAIATTPDGSYLYVGNSGSDNVSVIDTAKNQVITTIENVGQDPNGCAITPDGKYLYVANTYSNNVSVIDTSTNEIVTTTNVGTHPHGIAITPDGRYAYVANMDSNDISIIEIANNTVSGSITLDVGVVPFVLAITPNGQYAYVTNHNNISPFFYVYVIKTSNNTVTSWITGTGIQPNGIAITPDGQSVYVSNYLSNNVSVIDTGTNTVLMSINVGAEPGGIAITLPLLPPQNLTGKQEKNDFGFEYVLFNLLNWNTPQFYGFAGFFVYRNGNKIATLDRYARQYSDHNRIKGSSATYSVTSFSPTGEESDPITVQIN